MSDAVAPLARWRHKRTSCFAGSTMKTSLATNARTLRSQSCWLLRSQRRGHTSISPSQPPATTRQDILTPTSHRLYTDSTPALHSAGGWCQHERLDEGADQMPGEDT